MQLNIKHYLLSFSFLSLWLAPAALHAEDAPEVALQKTVEEVIDVLYQADATASLQEKRKQVLTILSKSFSFDIIVRRTLGRNWQRLSAQQQDQIVSLATDLMIHSYTQEFREGMRPSLVFEKPVSLSDNKLEISSVITMPNSHINLTYRLAHLESGWEVYDLLVEGVSLVSNYRKQFDAHFQKKGGDDLIQQLEEKLASL